MIDLNIIIGLIGIKSYRKKFNATIKHIFIRRFGKNEDLMYKL